MPHTQSPAELLELGKAYYSERHYERALRAFMEAFSASSSEDVKFLDMAVACYVKMEDLNSALALGRKMTKVSQRDARGYLRMGQVLQLQGKPEMALEIYKLGVRRCPEETPEKTRMLQGKRDELARKLSKPKSQDPIVVLPAEVMDIVMENLNFKHKVTCLRVSKSWRDFLSHQPALWAELDLSLARRPVPAAFVRNCIYRSKDKRRSEFLLHTAKFNRMKDADMVIKLVKACRKLKALEFLGSELSGSSIKDPVAACNGLRSLKLGKVAVITLDAVTQILKNRPTLVTAEFENIEARREATWDKEFPNLRHLVLGAGNIQEMGAYCLSAHSLVVQVPNIRSLSLIGWKHHTGLAADVQFADLQHLEALHLNYSFFAFQPRLPTSIRHLTLTVSRGWSEPMSMHRMIGNDLPVLEDLHYINEGMERDHSKRLLYTLLHRTGGLNSDGEPAAHLDNTSLRKFFLDRCPSGSSGELIKLLTRVPRLHHVIELSLNQAEFQDETLFAKTIIENFHNLKRLSIPSCKITGVGVKMLIKGLHDSEPSDAEAGAQSAGGGLRYLNLDWCMSISPDAVEWARSQGIEVSWKTTPTKVSGKKIRYG